MLGRPNLARYQCQEFRIVFHLDLSDEESSAALEGSYNYEDARGKRQAIYGKTYRANQQPHVVDGLVLNVEDGHYHFSFHVQQEDRGKPPVDIKSPDFLWNLALEAAPASEVDISFYGNFRYIPGSEWHSNLQLPLELERPFTLPRVSSFTHIAGVRFCNFEDADITDSIEVTIGTGGEITHEVRLHRKHIINARLIQRLFREGNKTSSALVTKLEEISYDDA